MSDHVEVHSTRNGDILGPAEVREKLGVDPRQVVDYLALVGDVSDNIKGAKGIGAKTAAGLLGIFGNLDDVYGSIDERTAALKPSQLASLEELRPRLEAVRALVTMRIDVPLDVAAVFNERVPKSAETFMEGEPMDEEPEQPLAEPTGTPVPARAPAPEIVLGQVFPRPKSAEEVMDGATMDEDLPSADDVRGILKDVKTEAPPPSFYESELAKHEPTPVAAKEPEPTALVPIEEPAPAEWERGLEPRSMHQAVLLAKRMHDSRMFDGYGTPQGVLSTVMLGRELGMPSHGVTPQRAYHRGKAQPELRTSWWRWSSRAAWPSILPG